MSWDWSGYDNWRETPEHDRGADQHDRERIQQERADAQVDDHFEQQSQEPEN